MLTTRRRGRDKIITMDENNFERVENFIYLSVCLWTENSSKTQNNQERRQRKMRTNDILKEYFKKDLWND